MAQPELVVFDMAGTTIQDFGQVPAAFTGALAEHGITVTNEQVSAVRGASKREALLRLIPAGPQQAQRADKIYASFREHLAQRFTSEGVRAISGAASVFHSLRNRGIRVALNTGFDRETTNLLLDALAWGDGMVDAIVCGDDVTKGRPAPYLIFRAMEAARVSSVHQVANVGDTTLDLQAGDNAGVRWNVGVLSGAHDRTELESAPHTHLIASVAELPRILELK